MQTTAVQDYAAIGAVGEASIRKRRWISCRRISTNFQVVPLLGHRQPGGSGGLRLLAAVRHAAPLGWLEAPFRRSVLDALSSRSDGPFDLLHTLALEPLIT